MYDDFETQTSYKYLQIVIRSLKEPVCILGGWAIYFHVNKNFKEAQGRDYLGSRDIDLGFHINKKWSIKELEKSALAQSLDILKNKLGFKPVTFRLIKDVHTETGKEITDEQVFPHQRFAMSVDPIVDHIPKNFKKVFGFQPIDEPLLEFVFQNSKHATELKEFDRKLLLPKPEILLATKINSIKGRIKEDKKIKDLCDIFALLWYSGENPTVLKNKVKQIITPAKIKESLSIITKNDLNKAANPINHNAEEIERIVLLDW